jgi:major pillin subunit
MKQQRGLTLLETMLTLAIIAIVASGILIQYRSVKSDQEVAFETDTLARIVAKMTSTYTQTTTLGSATEDTLTDYISRSKGFESNSNGGKLENIWGGDIKISPISPNKKAYSIIYKDVPEAECSSFVLDSANYVKELKVNGVLLKTGSSSVSVSDLLDNCTKSKNIIEFAPFGF